MGSGSMSDYLSAFIMWIVVTAILLPLTWVISASSITMDCEKLGGFYINHKTYKCELVK
jgi:hypothetical protein